MNQLPTSHKTSAFTKPIKSKCYRVIVASTLGFGLLFPSAAGAMAATTEPTLGPAVTASQASAANATAPSETVTGVSPTADGLNIDVSMSDVATGLQVNTIADAGAGNYKIQAVANGSTAGNFDNPVGQTWNTSINGNAATITVTDTNVNGTNISMSVSFASAPSTTPVFTISGSSTGTAPVAQKTDPTGADLSGVLDTRTQSLLTLDPVGASKPSSGYIIDPSTLMLIDPISGTPTTSVKGNATFTVNTGKVDVTAISNWNAFAQTFYTAKEKWNGAGPEPAGWTPGTITGQLKVQISGATPVQSSPTDCVVQPASSTGGKGFSVAAPTATSGGSQPACNLEAVAGSVTITGDATQETVQDITAKDIPTNSTYSVDPTSVQFRAPDGTFSNNVIYPGQVKISYDSVTRVTTTKRLGTSKDSVSVLRRVTESKLDANGNKVVGGSSSALFTVNVEEATTPIDVPAPVVPTTPSTPAPVISDPLPATVETLVVAPVAASGVRPFQNLGDTSAASASKVAVVIPKGDDNRGNIAAELALIALGTTGAFVVKARHRKVQASDVSAE